MIEIRDRFADKRRSRIIPDDGAMTVEDLIEVEDVVVTLTRAGYVKRTLVDSFRTQQRGGRGVRGTDMKEDDIVSTLLTCSTHDHLLFFTNQGRVYRIKAYQVPEKSREAKGVYVANVPGLALEPGERVAAVLALHEFTDDRFLVFATRKGTVKRTRLDAFDSPRSVLIAIDLRDEDELISVAVTDGTRDLMLVSRGGLAIRFPETDARSMGRTAGGVRGQKLAADDEVLAMAPVPSEKEDDGRYLLVVTERGFGKRTPLAGYRAQNRGGRGLITARITEQRGQLAGALVVPLEAEILLVTDTGTLIRMSIGNVRPMGRDTQGVALMRTGEQARVTGVALVMEEAAIEEATMEGVVAVENAAAGADTEDTASDDAATPGTDGTAPGEPAQDGADG
jgi:DNA gyrase subunit A